MAKDEELGDFHTIAHIGFVVEDIVQAAQGYAALFGVALPEITITDPLEKAQTRHRGQPTEARAKLAFLDVGGLTIELIEPVGGGPSIWQSVLEAEGEGLHHVAFWVEDMEETLARLERRGQRLIQRADFDGGCYAYLDTTEELGGIVELLARRQAPAR